jgi:4-amino-4-deoxy-L-arabinose transferase-like glycosyltransferase
VRRLLTDFDPILIGPGTSIGNMYLGPLYYYLMAPFLLIFNFSPAGPAIGVAILSILTIWLIWFVSRKWFGKFPALITAFLYALSPAVIIYSRSSWNPNIMPFFALLTIYATWMFWSPQSKTSGDYRAKYRWLVVAGVSFG